jgi:hypothetical protein
MQAVGSSIGTVGIECGKNHGAITMNTAGNVMLISRCSNSWTPSETLSAFVRRICAMEFGMEGKGNGEIQLMQYYFYYYYLYAIYFYRSQIFTLKFYTYA